jgi:hypothetical protein
MLAPMTAHADEVELAPSSPSPARITVPSLEELPPELRAFFQRSLERNGYVNNGNWVLAHCPDVFLGMRTLADRIDASGLISKRLHHLIAVLVAQRIGCPY